jgi:hypothetical protein
MGQILNTPDVSSFERVSLLLITLSTEISVCIPNICSKQQQAWSGAEVSRKLRFPDFMTTAQDGGKVVSLTHRPPLPLGIAPGTHFC